MGNTKLTKKANNKKATNNQAQKSTVPAGITSMYITPQRLVNWLKSSGQLKGTTLTKVLAQYKVSTGNNKPITVTPAMVTKAAKNILFFNTATNAQLSQRATKPQGFNAQGSNFTNTQNWQNKPLRHWFFAGGNNPPQVAWVTGNYPLGQRPCYFLYSACIAPTTGLTPAHVSGKNNTHVFANNGNAYQLAVALAPLVAGMPSATTLPPCNTWG
jgi:hypothetical protein